MTKTLLIVIGLACAVISAAGIMEIGWRNSQINSFRRQIHDDPRILPDTEAVAQTP